ncbi:hypothetical protein AS188_15055 [Kocuria flava]|uniref:Integrase/transposase n=1 Tax=Kocuria flava TaxID=446860 RepID=A0A0U3IBP4_9MICC|nr:helix-turn-helix domain-containing protein [Kocuria flava]ALU40844.1 hypothetical protein AS188_15055 [Kocuria flava]GEO93466.1 integrase/transposase [Kocuria flava]
MNEHVLDLSVSATVWFEGQVWQVVEHQANAVILQCGTELRKIHAPSLLGRAESVVSHDRDRPADDELGAIVLSALTPNQRAKVEAHAKVVRRLLEPDIGFPHVREQYTAAAAELGADLRTLQRMLNRYRAQGVAGLVDARLLKSTRRSVDPRWDAFCVSVLASYRNASNPTIKAVIARTNALYSSAHPGLPLPSQSVAYERVHELDKGRHTFDSAKTRRTSTSASQEQLGRLRADRPGQYVVLDTTRLDVFAMEPVTLRWLNVELTVAMDLYSRCIMGATLRAVAAASPDVAAVLYQTMTPQRWGPAEDTPDGPYAGVPEALVVKETGAVPDTIVVDHGKIYMSQHVRGLCHRFGINIQPARPGVGSDKPTVERFFRTLRQQLLEHLPAYKGPDVHSRGKDVEKQAFLYVAELEQIIREWIGIYHHTPHDGLRDPRLPEVDLSPIEMFSRGRATSGVLLLPASEDLVREFLQVEWRTIQHYGVEIHGRRYDGPGLNLHRGRKSHYGGAHASKWPFMVDPDDVRWVYFKDPDTASWHRLEWEHAHYIDAPFSQDAAEYTRRLSVQANRHVDPAQALQDLLRDWSEQQVTDRRAKNLALRLSTQRTVVGPDTDRSAREIASDPGVIDFFSHRKSRMDAAELTDDLDVFDKYYAEHPDAEGLEVFDE